MRFGLAVLDVGGTTIRDTADVAALFASTIEEYGISTSPEQLRRWRGASKREVIERLVTASSRANLEPLEVYRRFQQALVDAFTTHGVEPIPGAEAAIRCLRDNEVRVVLATGFDARVTSVLLEFLGWNAVVDGVVTADDVRQGRPAPDLILAAMREVGLTAVGAVVTVGDTANDLRAAGAAGVGASIGVLTGAHDRAQLEEVAHTAILASVAEVPKWLDGRQWAAA